MTLTDYLWIAVTGCIFSFFASMGIGANDVANALATSVGSKSLTYRQAMIVASIFEFSGAVLMGSHVTDTVRKGITRPEYFQDDPAVLMYGMMCVIASVGFWLAVATKYSLPVSTTHSCIGAIIGMTIVSKGLDAVNWEKVTEVVISWFIAPLLSGIIGSIGFYNTRHFILRNENSLERGIKFYPMMMFFTFTVNTFYFIYKGSPGLGLKKIDIWEGIGYSLLVSIVITPVVYLICMPILTRRVQGEDNTRDNSTLTRATNRLEEILEQDIMNADTGTAEIFDEKTENLFSFLQIFTACFDAFAHGANDVANSIGPLAAIISIYNSGEVNSKVEVPIWILVIGGSGIITGLVIFGYNIIKAIGVNLTKITPSRGFNIELGSAFTVITASKLGIPVSTTHCQVGATVGVGITDSSGKKNINCLLLFKVFFGWIITLVIAGGVAGALFAFGYNSPPRYSLCY